MLVSLQLKNYRCFQAHDITFRAMNVIVGANNAGKSTLVESLRLLSRVVSRYKGLTYARPPAWSELPARSLGVRPAMDHIDLRGGSVFHRYGDPPAVIAARFVGGMAVEVYVGPDNEVFALIYDSTGNLVKSKPQAREVEIPAIAILPQIGPLLENEPVLSEEYVLRSMDTALASRHFRNQVHYLPEHRSEFNKLAESTWNQLRIESLELEGDRPGQTISLHIRDTDFVAEVGWMGHGLQMWLQTMWFLSRSEGAGTVILDEPDVYMHADLQRRLIRLLRGRSGQTAIATHSVEIMSEVDPNDILIVDKKRRHSSFAATLPAVQYTIDRLGGVHNIHLARLWGSQRCLHVEGKDVDFLKLFQDALFPRSESPFDVIPRLSIGGWGGWQYAIGSSMSLKNAAGETIATYCIFDSDYHTADEIRQRYIEAAQHNVRLHVWRRKEIENYLLIPAVIARVIAENAAGTVIPESTEVHAACERIADKLKDRVFDALAHEYLSRERAAGVSGANKKARERLDAAWATPEAKFGIIPGKEVISALSDWSKETYGVSFGPLRLAREMKASEMSEELKTVVRAIEKSQPFPESLREPR